MFFGKYLRKYYAKYAIFYIIGVIALIVVDYIQLFIPEFLGKISTIITDKTIVESEKAAQIFTICGWVLAVAAGMMIGRIIWRYTIFHASTKIESDIRHDMYLKAQKLSLKYYHETKVGTVMAWFTNDIETLEEFVGFGTIMLVDALFLSIFVIWKMFALSWELTVLILIPSILIAIWGFACEKFMVKTWDYRQKTNDDLYDFSQESFTGIRVIKAFVKENQQIIAFGKKAAKNKDANIKFARLNAIFDVLISVIIGVIFFLLLAVGGYFVYQTIHYGSVNFLWHDFKVDSATIITFIGYFDSLIWPLIALGQIVSMYSRSKASLNRITAFLNVEEDIKNPQNPELLTEGNGEIEWKNFSFSYVSSITAQVKNVSLKIKKGERVGIIGKIGCGKTTLVNSLIRLYNLNEGQVFIDGHDVMKCDLHSLRDTVAYAPQDSFLFSDTVKRNIAFSDVNLSQEKIEEAAAFASVKDDIDNFKQQYETITGERGVTLSGGQKQRICIARAFIRNSPIFILDDSVSAVDVKTEETILHNIKTMREGKTTIVIASRISTVSHLDKVIVMNNGELEAFDTPENLLKISPTYQRMSFLQKLEQEVEGGK